jgi:hypothetical protein
MYIDFTYLVPPHTPYLLYIYWLQSLQDQVSYTAKTQKKGFEVWFILAGNHTLRCLSCVKAVERNGHWRLGVKPLI